MELSRLNWRGAWLSWISLSIVLCAVNGLNHFFSISDLCGPPSRKTLRMIEGAVLTSEGERDVECIITFQTDTILQKFMLRFERLQLDCNDHLVVYDGAYTTSPHKADLSCRNTLQNVGTIYTHSNHVTLNYTTDKWGPATNGFRLLITAFKGRETTCLNFLCQTTNFCIDRDLTCDGVNHCGDGSDESTSLAQCPSPFNGILGSSGTVVFAVVGTSILVCCGCLTLIAFWLYRRNYHAHQLPLTNAQEGVQMNSSAILNTNGTFTSQSLDKNATFRNPGLQHTVVHHEETSPGNLERPTLGMKRRSPIGISWRRAA